jgi:hypothetical protein
MSRWRRDLLELISPGRVRRKAIPPLEAGLRPNTRLDEATVLAALHPMGLDDVAMLDGNMVLSTGGFLSRLVEDGLQTFVELPGTAGALAGRGDSVAVAVEGHGLVEVTANGSVSVISQDPRLTTCVTALTALDDGSFLVCVGSTATDDWARNLVAPNPATGLLLRVVDGRVEELDRNLAWPSGVCADGDGGFLLSTSVGHRIERRSLADPGRSGKPLLDNLPGYPGRITPASQPGEWWVAVPYLRNRATELILEHDDVRSEMVSQTEPESWLVPCLTIENLYRTPLQVGAIRVLGEIKPWAPTRTYGLAFRVNAEGRVLESAHSRADGRMHGVTAVLETEPGSVVVACRGAGNVLMLGADH